MERVQEFKIGDWVCIRPFLTSTKYGLGSVTLGSIGIVYCIRPDSSLLIELSYLPTSWHCEPEEVEHVVPFRDGNWVRVKASVSAPRYGWEDVTRNSIGVIHNLEEDGDMGIAFCFRNELFPFSVSDGEKVPRFEVGQEIRVMPSVNQPRLGWLNESPSTVGKTARIDLDGALNVGRQSLWKVSPGDVEQLPGFEVGEWVCSKPSPGSRSSSDLNGASCIAVVHSVQDSGLRTSLVEPRWGWRGSRPESQCVLTGIHADGEVKAAFFGLPGLWRGDPADLEIEQMFMLPFVESKKGTKIWVVRSGHTHASIGTIQAINANGKLRIYTPEGSKAWMLDPSEVEVVEEKGFCIGDWVRPFEVGGIVRIKDGLVTPRWGWEMVTHSSKGRVVGVDANGKVRIKFQWMEREALGRRPC
ncbi:hypothetical protein JHK82_043554 [Glycine max]|nr:hypothetical protein JHK82_043554 [Glycine max]